MLPMMGNNKGEISEIIHIEMEEGEEELSSICGAMIEAVKEDDNKKMMNAMMDFHYAMKMMEAGMFKQEKEEAMPKKDMDKKSMKDLLRDF